jgi:hypothetical protein
MIMELLKLISMKQAEKQAEDMNPDDLLDMLSLLPTSVGAGLKVGKGLYSGGKLAHKGGKSLANLYTKINFPQTKAATMPRKGLPFWLDTALGLTAAGGTVASLPWLNRLLNPKAHDAIDKIIDSEETNPMEYFPPDSPELNPRNFNK